MTRTLLVAAGLFISSSFAVMRGAAVRAPNPDPVAERIWGLYSQVFAQGLRGQEGVEALVRVMTHHPPIALIRKSPAQAGVGAVGAVQGVATPQGRVSMGAWLMQVLRYAYDLDPQFPQNRILVPAELTASRYDDVDTLPRGGREVLRQALKKQFGLVARQETRENLALTVRKAAAGLQPHIDNGSSEAEGFRTINMTMAQVADRLAGLLGVEVRDQTGLAGGFDFTLTLPPGASANQVKDALLDQLGLELHPAGDNQRIEFLIVDLRPIAP